MKYFIYQLSDKDCGITCLKMCLSRYYRDNKYLFVNEYKEEISLLVLQSIFEKYNVKSTGLKVSYDLLNKSFYYSIIHVNENNGFHFLVLKKITKNNVYLIDPNRGLRVVTKDYFKDIFTKNLLKIEYINLSKRITIRFDTHIFSYIISLFIDFLFIYIASYILKGDSFVSLIFLSFAILMNIFLKIIIVLSKDKSLNKKLFTKETIDKLTISQIKVLSEYKSKEMQYQFTYVSYLLISLFVGTFLIINNPINSCYVLYSIIFAILKNFVLSTNQNKDNEKMINIENNYHLDHYKSYKKLNKLGYKYLSKIIIFYAIFVIFLIVLSVFINYFFEGGTLSNLLFMMTITITIYGLLDKFFCLKNKERHNVNLLKNRVGKILFKKKLFFE